MDTTAAVLRSSDSTPTAQKLRIGDHKVLMWVASSGICRTDLGIIGGRGPDLAPIVLGHEGSGVVDAIESGITTVAPGHHVMLCYNWRTVTNRSVANSSGNRRGRGHAIANEQNYVKMTRNLPREPLGPLGCCVQTAAGAVLNALQRDPGSSIVIFEWLCGTGRGGRRLRHHHWRRRSVFGRLYRSAGGPAERARMPAVPRCLRHGGFSGQVQQVHDRSRTFCCSVAVWSASSKRRRPRRVRHPHDRPVSGRRFPFDELITTFPFERINDALGAVHRGKVTKAVLTVDTTPAPLKARSSE